MLKALLLPLIFLGVVGVNHVCAQVAGNISLNSNGGYERILVHIDEMVEYHPDIYPRLKEYFINASRALYKATEYEQKRRYFEEVVVLLPRSWPTTCGAAGTELSSNANFIVENDSPDQGINPHTKREDSSCGTPDGQVILPRTFVVNDEAARKLGNDVGKTVLHEWSHMRYGLFDEYDETSTCEIIGNGRNYESVPLKCSSGIEGEIIEYKQSPTLPDLPDGVTPPRPTGNPGNGPPDTCEFIPFTDQPNAKSSLMYAHYLEKVYTFCDDVEDEQFKHNVVNDVDNDYNKFCGPESAWAWLRRHEDFNKDYDAPSDIDFEASLNFRCVQNVDLRMVLVMDISGSMNGARLQRLQKDVEIFLQSIPLGETEIGFVEFSTSATISHSMIVLDSDNSRQALINAIPQSTGGNTCIGCGIVKAIELLEQQGGSSKGSLIAVFTDGGENVSPRIAEIEDEVLLKEPVIYGLLVSTVIDDHDLIKIAEKTGGFGCIYYDNGATDYYDCLNSILNFNAPDLATETIRKSTHTLLQGESTLQTINVETPLTTTLFRFMFSWTNTQCNQVKVLLISPKSVLVTEGDDRYELDLSIQTISINGTGMPGGKWTYIIVNPSTNPTCDIAALVVGYAAPIKSQDPLDHPVTMSARVDKSDVTLNQNNTLRDNVVSLYSSLRKNRSPVINAQVTAVINSQNAELQHIQLLDNGIGSDLKANDGIYSAYFFNYIHAGVYNCRFEVNSDEYTQVLLETRSYGQGAPPLPQYRVQKTITKLQAEPFERSMVGGYFDVDNVPVGGIESWIPPSRVVDLKVSDFEDDEDINSVYLRIMWTAVGDNLDRGTADKYEVAISKHTRDLLHNFDNSLTLTPEMLTLGDLNAPQPSGQREEFTFDLSSLALEVDVVYYIGLRVMDGHGNASPVSNMASFERIRASAPEEPPAKEPGLHQNVGLWIGITFFAVALAVGIVGVVVVKKKKNKTSPLPDDNKQGSNMEVLGDFESPAKTTDDGLPPVETA